MRLPTLLLLTACLALAACDPVTMGLVTAGGGMAVNHQMSATASRTFSDGVEPVQAAVQVALQHMSIEVTRIDHRGEVVVIDAKAGSRKVSLQVEPVTRTSTQLQVAVHQDLLTLDGATGREIVAQTELALAQHATVPSTVHLAAGKPAPAATASVGSAGTVSDGASGRTTYYGSDHATAPTKVAKVKQHPKPLPPGSLNGAPSNAGATGTGATSASASVLSSGNNLAVAAAP